MFSHFRLLKNRNYALYFFGQIFSLTGTWLQQTVQSWLVYRLSHSTVWLGAVMFFTQVPAFLLSPVAGVAADRMSRKKLLIAAETAAMVQAFLFAELVFSGNVTLWHIVALSTVLGVVNAFDMTTRQAFTLDMVARSELQSAIALNSVMFNVTRIFGPALAGLLIAAVGEGWCFFLNGLSYLVVIFGLIAMRIPPLVHATAEGPLLRHMKEALAYVRARREILALLLIGGLVSLVAFPYMVLLPALVKDVLHGDARMFGWATALNGVGAIAGSLRTMSTAAQCGSFQKASRSLFFVGLSLAALALSPHFAISLVCLFLTGFFMMSIFPSINNAIQQAVDDRMRGRVMSLYTMSFLGAMPLGGMLAGVAANRFGPVRVIAASGAISAACGLLFWRSSGKTFTEK